MLRFLLRELTDNLQCYYGEMDFSMCSFSRITLAPLESGLTASKLGVHVIPLKVYV